jgi:hypothetical protein
LEAEDKSKYHYKGNIFDFARLEAWDLLIAFPPCQYLCKAQMWRCSRDKLRMDKQNEAVSFVRRLIGLPINQIAIENPPGALTKKYRPPDQMIYPYQFGDPYRKQICFWLKNLKPLVPRTEDKSNNKLRTVSNHVNSRMSQALKSNIKSNWKYFPRLADEIAKQWCT